MVKIKDIIQYLETLAPPLYQEGYDNSGLLTGDAAATVTNLLITLDTTEEVVEEAISKDCNLIVSHHPIVFKGLKSLTGKNYVERTVIKAIKNNIAIYAIHTNLDNVRLGVNKKICDKIGLLNTEILAPKPNTLSRLTTYIPKGSTQSVLNALHQAGAGQVGNYGNCSFTVEGTGTFTPGPEAHPTVGKTTQQEHVEEDRIEVILPTYLKSNVIKALKRAHPYEEAAYYISLLTNDNQDVGAGMIGDLPNAMEPFQFLNMLKRKMSLNCIRHTSSDKPVSKVAVCGGAGSFLLSQAIQSGADAFISADFKYHEFFDAEQKIMIADIGHYESEVHTKDLLNDILSKKFTNFALNLSEIVTNPISYL